MNTQRRIDRVFKWYKRRGGHAVVLRNELVVHYLPLVRTVAEKIKRRLPESVDVEDLVTNGVIGLMEAIESFDPAKKVKFSYFCRQRCAGAILDALRDEDVASRSMRQMAKRLSIATEQLQQLHGRRPAPEEVAKKLDMSPKQYAEQAAYSRALVTASISSDRIQNDDPGNAYSGPQLIDPTSPDPARETQRKAAREYITQGLSRAERLVVMLYYYEEMTMKEIGEVLDLSESRVSQMHTSVKSRIQARIAPQPM